MAPRRRDPGDALGAFVFASSILSFLLSVPSVGADVNAPAAGDGGGGRKACQLSVRRRDAIYNYSLTTPISGFPHGVLSEDGFYKVVVNGTTLWFQICDQMIFNHEPPRCFSCQGCGGSQHCGMRCSALVSDQIEGYPVCTTLGNATSQQVSLIDKDNPQEGVIVKLSSYLGSLCSLSVSVICDSSKARGPESFNKTGTCDYATVLRHPSGCANVISLNGNGWGWFGTLLMIIFCMLVGYFLIGTIYRIFFLGIHSAEAIPNLDFWLGLPLAVKSMIESLVRRFSDHTRDGRGSYASMSY